MAAKLRLDLVLVDRGLAPSRERARALILAGQVSVDVPREFHNARVPSLILQPMVENAIEHGIGQRAEGGAIRIGAVRNNGFLMLSVYNEGPRIPENWEEQRTGVGISNVRARLQNLYGRESNLDIRNREDGVEVQLSVPYKAK